MNKTSRMPSYGSDRQRTTSSVMPAVGRGRERESSGEGREDDEDQDGTEELPQASILIVDDVAANLVSLEAVLTPLGHRIVRASSGEEALKRILTDDFAVVLLDVQMPGLDGFETAALIKTHPRLRATPIIFITAISRDAAHVFRGYEHGAVDYLLKPFEPDILRSKVRVLVDLHLRGERIKAQARLLRERDLELAERRGRDRYVNLMETMPIALWATTDDGSVYYANRAWREYSGFTSGELVGFTDRRVVHEEDRPHVATAWLAAVQQGGSLELPCRLQRSLDGAYRWHLLRATPESRDRSVISGWIVTATDIDESKRADEIREELLLREQVARRQAEDANRSKDEFLASVSHELRTPLHAILGWTKMLRSGAVDPAQTERALATIERNAQVQASLVDDLLDVSRVVAGKFDIQIRVMQLSSVANAAVEALQPSADEKGVKVALTLGPRASDPILGDPQRLQQVLWNLASNAVKFTPSGGSVNLEVGIRDGFAEMIVSDSGIGLTSDFIPFAFDRFTQADPGITRAHGGLGLGLSIARHLVELHGGTVTAESAGRDRGAAFIVRFPARTEVSERPPAPEVVWQTEITRATRVANPLADAKIVVVDDDDDARELLATVLERSGAQVFGCASAAEAVETIMRVRPDMMVSDIGLPGEDGYSMMSRIRRLPASEGGTVPAIAVSGYARSDDRARALEAGFQAHLAKPVELPELLALLGRFANAAADEA